MASSVEELPSYVRGEIATSFCLLLRDGDCRLSFTIVSHRHLPRLAAHRAILDVILRRAAARIEGDADLLGAIRTRDASLEIGGSVAKRKVGVQWVRFVGEQHASN